MTWISDLSVSGLDEVYSSSSSPWSFDPDVSWWETPPVFSSSGTFGQEPQPETQQEHLQHQGYSGKTYFESVKHELFDLICGSSKKYTKLRNSLKSSAKNSEVAVVSAIAAEFAKYVGMSEAFLVPICAQGLKAILLIGHTAFCARQSSRG